MLQQISDLKAGVELRLKVTRASWLLRTESDTRQLEASLRLIWGLLGAKS